MSSCSSCGAKSKKYIYIYKNNLRLMNTNYIDSIISYANITDVIVLHVTNHEEEHMICHKCFDKLRNIAHMCDTNIVSCPACNRMIFI